MIKNVFNISKFIKASMILVLALMLNIAGYSCALAGFWEEMAKNSNPNSSSSVDALSAITSSKILESQGNIQGAGEVIERHLIDNNVDTETAKAKAEEHVSGYVSQTPNSNCDVSQFKAQYQSGCWSCLVIEQLLSAFLNAARHGIPVTQKAGTILLILGTILWLAKWALNNVSSFNEIQTANIFNELFKFSFKVMLAYFFIGVAVKGISQYFVRPIMSVGAIVGQNMWDEDIVEYTEAWDDLSDIAITKAIEEAEKQPAAEESEDDIDEEKKKELEDIKKKDKSSTYEIPPFQVPGTSGSITSFPGCRIPPPTSGQSSCGSFSHMGLDVAAQSGAPIWAVAGGKATYLKSGGWGNMVKITTKHKGASWTHIYAHMNDKDWSKYKSINQNKEVARGEIIGGVGSTGNSSGPHLHLEIILTGTVDGKKYNNDVLDPISLGDGKIVVRGKKNSDGTVNKDSCTCGKGSNPACQYHSSWKPAQKAKDVERSTNKICRGFNSADPKTSIPKKGQVPPGGITNPGTIATPVSTAYIGDDKGYTAPLGAPIIEKIVYTGPTDIFPKSIMNSMLGAMRAITNITAENMVLGRSIMCYANLENGGKVKVGGFQFINIFMWLEGLIILLTGLLLTMSIGYYFLDISFKIGFSVLALPIVIGLWPFEVTKDRLKKVVSIMLKASASFAFMAIITSYGMSLVSETFGGLEELYDKIGSVNSGMSNKELDALNGYIKENVSVFSMTFILLCFSMFYFFSLIKESIDKYTNHFFPDAVFGTSKPMHEGAKAATEKVGKIAAAPAKLAGGYIGTQFGNLGQKATAGIGRATGKLATKTVNLVTGHKENSGGGEGDGK